MNNYICENKNFTLGGKTNDTIALSVEITNIPETIEIEGITLIKKTKFHISLVCIGRLMKKHNLSNEILAENIVKDFCAFIKENDVALKGYKNEFRFVEEGELKALVVMCEISNLNVFFGMVNEKYNINFEYQPTHVTLYTLQPDVGIFLIDADDLDSLSHVVQSPPEIIL